MKMSKRVVLGRFEWIKETLDHLEEMKVMETLTNPDSSEEDLERSLSTFNIYFPRIGWSIDAIEKELELF